MGAVAYGIMNLKYVHICKFVRFWFKSLVCQQLCQEIEEHLGVTIETIEADMKVPINEFDGKVVYGEKARSGSGLYQGHVNSLAPAVAELAALERQTQTSFLSLHFETPFLKC